MTTSQIAGFTSANIAQVEGSGASTDTHAMRGTLRAEDYTSFGIFSVAGNSGIMAAGLVPAVHTTGVGTLFSWRWGDATRLALVRRVLFSAANDATGFTAGLVQFNLFVCRSFPVSFSGGTALTPSGNTNKMRTSMATSLLSDCRISTTTGLTVPAPLPGWDGSPTASLICGVPATAGSIMIPPSPLIDQRPGEHPFVFAQNEGFTIEIGGIAIAATGTWKFGVKVDWSEVAAYP